MDKRLHIYIAREEDFAAFRDLRLRGLQESPRNFGSTYEDELYEPITESRKRFLTAVHTPSSGVFVASNGEHLVGCGAYTREFKRRWNHVATVWGMYVDPRYRKQGLGRAIIMHILGACQRHLDIKQIELEYTEGNEAAKRTYERAGFTQWGVRKRSLQLPDGSGYDNSVCMGLNLEEPRDVRLETERLILRRWTLNESDIDAAHACFADPDVMQHVGDGSNFDFREQTIEQLRDLYISHQSASSLGRFAIERKEDGLVMGIASVIATPELGEIEVGYLLAKPFWSQGYATEVGKRCVDYALKDLGLLRVIGVTKPGHWDSQQVLLKAGMQQIEDSEYNGERVAKFEAWRQPQ